MLSARELCLARAARMHVLLITTAYFDPPRPTAALRNPLCIKNNTIETIPVMAVPAVEFHRFPELPAELREEIWLYCLPQRVLELTALVDSLIFWRTGKPWSDNKWPCELFHTSRMNQIPPLISRVCHESRSLCFKTGSIQRDPSEHTDDRPPEAQWIGLNEGTKWLDRSRDSAHLGWTSAYEAQHLYTDDLNPLDYLAWESSHLPHGGSLMINALDEYYGRRDPWASPAASRPRPTPSTLNSHKKQDLAALQKITPISIVMRVVVVHTDSTTAGKTGLFGLMADARIQIVDIADADRLNALFELAELYERSAPAIFPQDFSRESLKAMHSRLRDVILNEFGSKELAGRVRPAIMFRLCTRDCNHLGYEYRTNHLLGLLGHHPAGYGQDWGMRTSERDRVRHRTTRWDHDW